MSWDVSGGRGGCVRGVTPPWSLSLWLYGLGFLLLTSADFTPVKVSASYHWFINHHNYYIVIIIGEIVQYLYISLETTFEWIWAL